MSSRPRARRLRAYACAVLGVVACVAIARDGSADSEPAASTSRALPLEIGGFSRAAGALPKGWEPLTFAKIPRLTRYTPQQDDGRWLIKAESSASASGLIRVVPIDLRRHPIVRWSWKIDRVLAKGDIETKAGDDHPARLYIAFRYEPERVGLWKKTQFLAARAILGDLPIGAIAYVWASRADQTQTVDSPHSGSFAKVIPVRSGARDTGAWQTEERNVYADYVREFGEEPPLVEAVAIMTDTDNTGESATAYYGDIVFLPGSE